ncbi:putative ABC transporter [Neospora caninum Liverpool]|uniref:ABC transporter, putative n=1 Tax=Neospora caninum (strain Liverpool) TaxID=572307 RepID=F0VBS2_NEOCL|nr:putative ABC transporter [Neospora caninum Liverpool]CBZ51056.1 putative ABC transporter [Neospora caninum Liverpool]CEL68362.1 TPA: ABC transporter, putative [Neospora caninum Liverpool]|eukprot:XP_003881089.1 putative ABC transporter [Neospora caninum Liverpool]
MAAAVLSKSSGVPGGSSLSPFPSGDESGIPTAERQRPSQPTPRAALETGAERHEGDAAPAEPRGSNSTACGEEDEASWSQRERNADGKRDRRPSDARETLKGALAPDRLRVEKSETPHNEGEKCEQTQALRQGRSTEASSEEQEARLPEGAGEEQRGDTGAQRPTAECAVFVDQGGMPGANGTGKDETPACEARPCSLERGKGERDEAEPEDDAAWHSRHLRPFGPCTVVVKDICFTLPPKRDSKKSHALRRCWAAVWAFLVFSKYVLTLTVQRLGCRRRAAGRQQEYVPSPPSDVQDRRVDATCNERDAGGAREEANAEAQRGLDRAHLKEAGACSGKRERATSEDVATAEKATQDKEDSPERQTILHPFSAVFDAGTMTAVMGPSGCGKTTLLNLLANRAPARQSGGEVFVNGKPRDRTFNRRVAFVQQEDIFDGKETVRECLEFSRDLRMNFAAIQDPTERQRAADAYTDQALRVLGLQAVADSPVGNEAIRGVSGGQKRRVTLGLGLMSDAQIFLCDEPTTGLSAADALAVVRTLRRLCDVYSVTVVAVIHQPSMQILSLFDNLILLSCEGRCAYNGKVVSCQPCFESWGFAFPLHQNPADYLSDLVSPHKGFPARLAALYAARELPGVKARVAEALRGEAAQSDAKGQTGTRGSGCSRSESEPEAASPSSRGVLPVAGAQAAELLHGPSWWTQFSTIARRSARLWLRDRSTVAAIYADAVVEGAILGLVMLGVRQRQPPYYQLSALYLFVFCACASALWTIPLYVQQKAQFIMEASGGYYSPEPHYLGTTCVTTCIIAGSDVVLCCILWVLAGFEWATLPFSLFVSILAYLVVDGAFYLATLASTSFAHANSVTSVLFMIFIFVNGFSTNPQSMPFWICWMSYICPFFLAFEAAAIEVMRDYRFASGEGVAQGGAGQAADSTDPEQLGALAVASAEDLFQQYGLAGRVYGATVNPEVYVWAVDVVLLLFMAIGIKGFAMLYQSWWVVPRPQGPLIGRWLKDAVQEAKGKSASGTTCKERQRQSA